MLSSRDVCQISCRPVPFAPAPSVAPAVVAPAVQPGAAGRRDTSRRSRSRRDRSRRARSRQSVVVLALIVLVVVLDQAAKWWAWRHLLWTRINPGGDALVGRTIGAWYAGPVTGPLLDLLDCGLVGTCRRQGSRRPDDRGLGQQPVGPAGHPLLDRPGQRPRRGRFHPPRPALLQLRGLLHHRLHVALRAGRWLPGHTGGVAAGRGRERPADVTQG